MAASGQIPVTASNVTGLAAGVMARARRIQMRLGYFRGGPGSRDPAKSFMRSEAA